MRTIGSKIMYLMRKIIKNGDSDSNLHLFEHIIDSFTTLPSMISSYDKSAMKDFMGKHIVLQERYLKMDSYMLSYEYVSAHITDDMRIHMMKFKREISNTVTSRDDGFIFRMDDSDLQCVNIRLQKLKRVFDFLDMNTNYRETFDMLDRQPEKYNIFSPKHIPEVKFPDSTINRHSILS